MEYRVLVAEDSRADQAVIRGMLPEYDLVFASDGLEALSLLANDPTIEIMLLDLNMPRLSGFEVLELMGQEPRYNRIATLILTNHEEVEAEVRGLSLGALDYIRKPLNLEALRKRLEVHVNLKKAQKELEEYNAVLEKTVRERTHELILTRDTTIHALIGLLEARDIESSNHIKRTQWIMKALCAHLSHKDRYRDILTDAYIHELFNTAPLHDIGKVGIPDNILLKPGKLNEEEFAVMRRHTTIGMHALQYASEAGSTVSFIRTALEIIGGHHEKYDGSGYPNGLAGEEIPLSARLMAVIDVYDALISKRVYKPAFAHEEALRMIVERKGTHFDPNIVDAFLEIEPTIKEITGRYYQFVPGV